MSVDCSGCHPEMHELCKCRQTIGCRAHSIEKSLTISERHARNHPDEYLKESA